MKTLKIFFGLLIFISSCNSNGQEKENDLNVPNQIQIKKDNKHVLLVGTRIFVSIPQGYHLRSNLLRIEKDNNPNVYFQFMESNKTNFLEKKLVVKEKLQNVKDKGYNVYYEKEFKIDNCEALLVYGSNDETTNEISLNYGTANYAVIISGKIPRSEISERDKILNSILSSYVDESVTIDPNAFSNYTLDLTNSDFKFNSNISQLFYYTVDGKGDPVNNVFQDQIMVCSMPAMENQNARTGYAKSMIDRYRNNGIKISEVEEKEFNVGDNTFYEIKFNGNYQGTSLVAYQIVTGNNSATMLFCGMAYTEKEKRLKQFVDIAKTLKIK